MSIQADTGGLRIGICNSFCEAKVTLLHVMKRKFFLSLQVPAPFCV